LLDQSNYIPPNKPILVWREGLVGFVGAACAVRAWGLAGALERARPRGAPAKPRDQQTPGSQLVGRLPLERPRGLRSPVQTGSLWVGSTCARFVEATGTATVARCFQVGPDTTTEMRHFLLCGEEQLHDLHSKLHLLHPRGEANQLHKCIVAAGSGNPPLKKNSKMKIKKQATLCPCHPPGLACTRC
jgi:SUF system FeS cluster assembly, SufBD